MMRGRVPRASEVALLLAGIVVALAAAEAVLRARGVLYGVVAPHADPQLKYTLRPNQKGRVGRVEHSYNARGLRDRDYSDRPGPGVTRILSVGDSITFGQTMSLEQTFPKRIESSLNARAEASRFEVLNGGVSGYNACQEEAFFRNVGSAYHPHLVIWEYCLNDVDDPWDPYRSSGAGYVPLPASWKRSLSDHLVLWNFLKAQLYAAVSGESLAARGKSNEWYARRIFALYDEKERSRRDGAWQCILRARDEMMQSGIEMLLVAFPFEMQAVRDSGYSDAPQREIARRCAEAGLACLDLLPTFARTDAAALFLSNDFIHLSDEGHRVTATAIERELSRRLPDVRGSGGAALRD